jgi:hypothetical protein
MLWTRWREIMNDLALSEETAVAPADIFVDGNSITEFDLEETCRGIVARLQETSDTAEIAQAVTNLNGVEKFAARAKSKLIFEWSCWYKTNSGLDNFAEWYTQKFGGETLTVQKHQAIGELLSDDEVPDNVKQLNTKELVSVSRAKQSGYDLTESWEEIAHAGSEREINEIVRKVKGKPERTGTLNIKVYQDGAIMGFMGDVVVNLGWLNYADRDNDDTEAEKKKVLEIGIARIINNSRAKVS